VPKTKCDEESMTRRRRETLGESFKNHLRLSSADFSIILADFNLELGRGARANMQGDLAVAFASFRGDRRVLQWQLKANELKEDLKRIQRTAAKLAKLLDSRREAADAMARAARPELDKPTLATWPTAPPIFQRKAVEIECAAKLTLATSPRYMPYICSKRGNVPLDRLVERVLTIWVTYAGEAPTFLGDDQGNISPFVRFALACCRHLEFRTSASALSKRAARLYAALSGPKIPKIRRPRGPTQKSTGHVVRKR
jgi:hypothetical protein